MKVSQEQKEAIKKKLDRAITLTKIIEKGQRRTGTLKLERGPLYLYVLNNNMCKVASKEFTSLLKDISEFRKQISDQSQK